MSKDASVAACVTGRRDDNEPRTVGVVLRDPVTRRHGPAGVATGAEMKKEPDWSLVEALEPNPPSAIECEAGERALARALLEDDGVKATSAQKFIPLPSTSGK